MSQKTVSVLSADWERAGERLSGRKGIGVWAGGSAGALQDLVTLIHGKDRSPGLGQARKGQWGTEWGVCENMRGQSEKNVREGQGLTWWFQED